VAGLQLKILDENVEVTSNYASISTMHLAKGLEFRAVVVMACDDEVIPLQQRIERTSVSALPWVYVCLGRSTDALRIAREAVEAEAIEKDSFVGEIFLLGLAQIDAHTGRSEEAVKILRRLLTIPAGEYISLTRLKIDPVWDPLRNDPDFQKLISEPEAKTVYK
jgi:hypothetical protein